MPPTGDEHAKLKTSNTIILTLAPLAGCTKTLMLRVLAVGGPNPKTLPTCVGGPNPNTRCWMHHDPNASNGCEGCGGP